MLRAAGVDRLALPERARTLDTATRARLLEEWRAQRELATALARDAERASANLPARALVNADIDDEIAGSFPVPPAAGAALRWPERDHAADVAAMLEVMRATHPVWGVRALAAVALAWRGELSREVITEVRGYARTNGALGVLAAAVLCGWRARRAGVAPSRLDDDLEQALRRGLSQAELAPWCAVALSLARAGDDAGTTLRALGDDAAADLRLGAALVLGDEHALSRFVDDDDEERREAARAALAERGSPHLVALLMGADEAPLPPDRDRRALVRRLPEPLPGRLVPAVLACVAQGGDELAREALRVLQRTPFVSWAGEQRVTLAAVVNGAATRLGAELVVQVLAWVVVDGPPASAIAPFARAARAALAGAPLRERVDVRALEVLLRVAGDDELTPLDDVAADAELGARLFGRVLDLWARREHAGVDVGWLERRCARWWSTRPASVAAWARALGSRTGMSGRDDVVAFFWRRFCAHPEERVAVAAALRPWSQLLHEVRDAAPPSERPGGDELVAVWDVWAAAEPHDMWRLVDVLNPAVPHARLAAFAERVFDAAEGVVAERPRTGIVTVFRVCAEIANRVRHHDANEELDHAAAVIERRMPGFAERFAAARATDDTERGAEHFLDDIATERRLIGEVYQRRREQAAREREREDQRRLAEQRREAQRLEQQRRDEAASIQVRSSPGHASAPRLTLPEPDFPRGGFDDEPFIAGPGPRTIVEYAQLMKALQQGHDALAVFAAWHLDAASWAACATRWSALMMSRSDVAMRFAALLSERWR